MSGRWASALLLFSAPRQPSLSHPAAVAGEGLVCLCLFPWLLGHPRLQSCFLWYKLMSERHFFLTGLDWPQVTSRSGSCTTRGSGRSVSYPTTLLLAGLVFELFSTGFYALQMLCISPSQLLVLIDSLLNLNSYSTACTNVGMVSALVPLGTLQATGERNLLLGVCIDSWADHSLNFNSETHVILSFRSLGLLKYLGSLLSRLLSSSTQYGSIQTISINIFP